MEVAVPQFLVSWLTSFQPWMPRPITAGGNLLKSKGIATIPFTVITTKRSAYIFLPSRNKISRGEGGDQEMFAV